MWPFKKKAEAEKIIATGKIISAEDAQRLSFPNKSFTKEFIRNSINARIRRATLSRRVAVEVTADFYSKDIVAELEELGYDVGKPFTHHFGQVPKKVFRISWGIPVLEEKEELK